MYKKASKLRLRIATSKGLLSAEQLWDLTLAELDSLAVSLEKAYKSSGAKSFLAKKTKKDIELKLKFDLVLDVLTTKAEEIDAASSASETRKHNTKIDELIVKKQDEELGALSVKELENLRK